MKFVEKKFQTLNVGSAFITEEYLLKLDKKGYELHDIILGPNMIIEGYTFKLKEEDIAKSEGK